MQTIKLVLLTILFLSFSVIQTVSAETSHRGPGPHPHPHPQRPSPYPDYRPGPRPAPAPRPMPRDDYYNRGRVTCSAQDRGWEEHWSGHSSCGECVQRHGNCVESCYEVKQVCEVQGTDYYGRTQIFIAQGPDRWMAENEARRRCEWNRDMRYCQVTSCRQDNQLISTRSCR